MGDCPILGSNITTSRYQGYAGSSAVSSYVRITLMQSMAAGLDSVRLQNSIRADRVNYLPRKRYK